MATFKAKFGEVEYEVRVDEHSFGFSVEMADGESLYSMSREELGRKIAEKTRKLKMEHRIPVVLLQREGYARAFLRARHGRARGYLFVTPAGEKFHEDMPSTVLMGDEITDEDLQRLNALRTARQEAERAEREFVTSRREAGHRRGNAPSTYADTLLRAEEEKRLKKEVTPEGA